MTNNKYTELKISELDKEKNELLVAAIKICSSALWLKEHLFVGDDGEWDYKLNKALNAYRDDIEEIAEIKLGDDLRNTYSGTLTLETLLEQFEDFYWLVNMTSPLGEKETELVIAFGFLEAQVKSRKEILTSPSLNTEEVKKPKKVNKKVKKGWHETPTGVITLTVVAGLIVAFLSFTFGWG